MVAWSTSGSLRPHGTFLRPIVTFVALETARNRAWRVPSCERDADESGAAWFVSCVFSWFLLLASAALRCSPSHSLPHSLTHSLTHSLAHSLPRSLPVSFVHAIFPFLGPCLSRGSMRLCTGSVVRKGSVKMAEFRREIKLCGVVRGDAAAFSPLLVRKPSEACMSLCKSFQALSPIMDSGTCGEGARATPPGLERPAFVRRVRRAAAFGVGKPS